MGQPDRGDSDACALTMPLELSSLVQGRELGRQRTGPLPVGIVTMELQRGVMGDLASFPALRTAADEVGLVRNAIELCHTARSLHLPVVHCTAEFRADKAGSAANTPLHSAVFKIEGHLVEGSPAVELVEGLGPDPADLVVPRRHGVAPFAGTSLDATLRNLGVDVLVVAGVSVNLGVLGLVIEAVDLGYQVLVASDAVCGVPAHYADAVLAESIGLVATVAPTEQILRALRTAITA